MTVRRLLFSILAGLAVGCGTAGPKAQGTGSTAEVVVTSLTPSPASELQRTSEIDAGVEYTIDNFQADRNHYYLTIQFEQTGGGSFNHYRRFSDEPVLASPHGTVHVNYALARVWGDARLKKPIRLWFYIVERAAPHDSLIIGRAGPFEYLVK